MKESLKNGLLLAVFMLAVLALYIVNSELLSFFVVYAFLGLVLLDVIIWAISSHFLSLNVVTKESVDVRGNTAVVLEMQNRCIFPVWCMRVEMELVNVLTKATRTIKRPYMLMPFEKDESVISLRSNHCGKVYVKSVRATHWDGLHILSKQQKCTTSGSVIVYPQRVKQRVEHMVRQESYSAEQARYLNRKGNDPTEILDIRDYQRGDNVKSIHWKLSKKLKRTVVKELNMPAGQDTLLMFCAQNLTGDNIDCVVQCVLNVSRDLLEQDILHDALVVKEDGSFSVYEILDENTCDLYEQTIMDGDVVITSDVIEEHFRRSGFGNRYSNIICVTDCEENSSQRMEGVEYLVAEC